MEMSRLFEKIIGVIAILLGITVLILAITSNIVDSKLSKWTYIDSTVIYKQSLSDKSPLFKYKVSYIVNDKKYVKEIKLTIDKELNDKITIKYNPNNPEEITGQTKPVSAISEYIVAVIISLFGIYMFFIGIKKKV